LSSTAQAAIAPAVGVLRYRDFRYVLLSQALSNVGSWMQITILPWLVLRETGSSILVGITAAAQYFPILIAGPIGGLVADRLARNRIVLATQLAAAAPAVGLMILATRADPSYVALFAGGLAWGLVQLFDAPARQALVADTVPAAEATRAYALSVSMWHIGSVVGPALVGVLLSTVDVQSAFLVMALLFVIGAAFLALVRGQPHGTAEDAHEAQASGGVFAGLAYARRNSVVAALLMLVTGFSLFAMNRQVLVPLFAEDVLHTDSGGFSVLMAASGAGALAGGVLLAVIGKVGSRLHIWLGLCWAFTLLGFGLSALLWVTALFLAASGICQMMFMTAALGRLQVETPPKLRGRIMAFHAQAMTGAAPVGAAQIGLLADAFGPNVTAIFCGVLSAAVAILVWTFVPGFRRDATLSRESL
jgi:MFS family permease